MRIIITILLCFILLYVGREAWLLRRSRDIGVISAAFSREYYIGNPANPPLLYVALGDSTVQGTGAHQVQQTLPYLIATNYAFTHYVHVINLGISGAKVADLPPQLAQLAKYKPDLITLNIGANDASHFTNLDEYRRDLQNDLSTLNAQTVLIANAPDLSHSPALPIIYRQLAGYRADQQNKILNQISGNVKIIDLYGQGKLLSRPLYAEDAFHPSPSGYAIWASLYPRG